MLSFLPSTGDAALDAMFERLDQDRRVARYLRSFDQPSLLLPVDLRALERGAADGDRTLPRAEGSGGFSS